MGIAIPQLAPASLDRTSGAQVIDGSLKFDEDKNTYLKVTPGSDGNRRTWTWSGWVKRNTFGSSLMSRFFMGGTTSTSSGNAVIAFYQDTLFWQIGSSSERITTNRLFRDTGWYHIVVALDTTQGTDSNRVKIYVNGQQETSFSTSGYPSQNTDSGVNSTQGMLLGAGRDSSGNEPDGTFDGQISNSYLIDGQALDASYFGFTDPLTNTWKPKKYTGTFGTNGFYLPLDGNSPIGKDQSGNGNDFTPVNFGGSVALDNPQVSGARPILNTTQGGTQAGVGVFGSKQNVGYAVTVYNDGGGNKYYIDGVKQDTVTGLIRGATYTFDTSDSTVSSHPFRFSATSNGSHGGGSEYTNGVAAITGAATTITVPHDAPNTLYYYCTSHSGMGADITGISTNEKLADQYASSCVLAVPLVGGANDVSASIACTMSTKTVTVSGAAADSFERNFYGESFIFDGSNDQLSYSAGSDFDFGGGDFTLETWLNMDTIGAGQAILEFNGQSSATSPDGQWYFSTSNGWHWYHSSSAYAIIPKARVPTDKWIHMALVREGNAITHYLNGVCEASSSYTRTDAGSSSRAPIIGQQNSSSYFDGHLQDYRIYKGVAKYSGTTVGTQYFVPPSPRFPDILPDTLSGVSGGSKLTKITDGAVAFNEAGTTSDDSYLSVASSSDFAFGTGDFTIEYYLFLNSTPTTATVPFDMRPLSTNGAYPQMTINSSLSLSYYVDSANRITSSSSIPTQRWLHISVCRSGSSTKMFVNGVQSGSTYSDSNNYQQSGINIGSNQYAVPQYGIPGFITNFRVVKGTALYTKNFTPPTEPLTNVTNTKLLCCQSNALAGSATVAPTISGLNDGRVWSSGPTTGSVYASDNDWNNVFNGVAGNDKAIAANDATYEITLPGGGISGVTKVEIYGQQQSGAANATITLSSAGEQSVAQGTSLGYTTFYTGSSDTLTKLKVASTSSNRSSINAVRINDTTILTDPLTNSVGASPDAAATDFNPFITDINTVRGQESGYCTMNPLSNIHGVTLSDGNLKCNWPTDGDGESVAGTIAIPMGVRGKFYWELDVKAATGGGLDFGIVRSDQTKWMDGTQSNRLYNHPEFSGLLGNSGSIRSKTGIDSDVSNYLSATANGSRQTFMVCVDALEGKLWIGKDGVWGNNGGIGNPALGLNPGASNLYADTRFSYLPVMMGASDSGTSTTFWNFGQKPFKYAPPDGFQPLNTANTRPAKVISRPDQYVGVTTYTGSGSARSIDIGMKPDLVWFKSRNQGNGHRLVDSVRGVGKALVAQGTDSEKTETTGLTSFDKNGYSIGSASDYNASSPSTTYVNWAWKAGGNKNTFNVDDVGYASASDVNMNVGGLNSSFYNQSQTWSNDLVSDNGNYFGTQTPAKAFDGDLTTKCTSSTGTGGTLTLDLSNNNLTGTLEVVTNTGMSVAVTHSGGTTTIAAATSPDQAETINFGSLTSISQIVVTGVSAPSNAMLYGIKLNGAELIDSGVSVTNVPSIAATGCSVGTKQGFSIIKFDSGSSGNKTLSHGLSETPTFIMVKTTGTTSDWSVYHKDLGGNVNNYLVLNSSSGNASATNIWGAAVPTSSVFGIKSGTTCATDQDVIAYCWHDVPGLQKFGKYSGNQSADGPFIELGFRPAMVWIKGIGSGSTSWRIFDKERNPTNTSTTLYLRPNVSNGDLDDTRPIDIVSNGFKIRVTSGGDINLSSGAYDYIYCAWADVPTVDLYGGGANAR